MATSLEPHPSKEVLFAFAEGLELNSDLQALESHIAECTICAETLREFDPAGGLVKYLRSAFVEAHTDTDEGGETSPGRDDLGELAAIRAFLQFGTRADSLGRLGHYELLALAGRGTFGTVFKAFDDILKRVVAIKLLTPNLATTDEASQRFLREARAAAGIRHENVVQIHSVHDTPLPYLVMEFIPGMTVQQRLDTIGPFCPADVARMGRQIAAGLSAAHAKGLIHRDIKPGNILIDSGDDEERIKITDFGLARPGDDASLSQTGMIAGTPLYMSPEQIKGAELDSRSDLFSLGSVLYAMLCGRSPFRGANTLTVIKSVCEDRPRPIGEIVSQAPPDLCEIIGRLHAKPPAERFQSAREVADALARSYNAIPAGGAPSTSPAVAAEAGETLIFSAGQQAPNESQRRRKTDLMADSLSSRVRPPGWKFTLSCGFLALAVVFAVIVIRTNESEIVIETESPDIAAQLDQNAGIVVENRKTGQTISLSQGKNRLPNGDYELNIKTPEGLEFTAPQITMKRFGSVLATIRARQVTTKERDDQTPAVQRPQSFDAPRELAQYLVNHNAVFDCTVLSSGERLHEIATIEKIPSQPFEIWGVVLRSATDSDVKSVVDLAAGRVPFSVIYISNGYGKTRVTGAILKELARLPDLDNVGVDSLSDIQAEDLEVLVKLPNLRLLNLGHMPIGDDLIQRLHKFPLVTNVLLNQCGVTDEGLLPLRTSRVTHLYLGSTSLTDRACEILAQMPRLEDLTIEGCLGFHGATLEKLQRQPLRRLHLGYTGLREDALKSLRTFSKLETLSLLENSLTDSALPHLFGLPIKTLRMRESRITPAGLQRLRDALPKCQVDAL